MAEKDTQTVAAKIAQVFNLSGRSKCLLSKKHIAQWSESPDPMLRPNTVHLLAAHLRSRNLVLIETDRMGESDTMVLMSLSGYERLPHLTLDFSPPLPESN